VRSIDSPGPRRRTAVPLVGNIEASLGGLFLRGLARNVLETTYVTYDIRFPASPDDRDQGLIRYRFVCGIVEEKIHLSGRRAHKLATLPLRVFHLVTNPEPTRLMGLLSLEN